MRKCCLRLLCDVLRRPQYIPIHRCDKAMLEYNITWRGVTSKTNVCLAKNITQWKQMIHSGDTVQLESLLSWHYYTYIVTLDPVRSLFILVKDLYVNLREILSLSPVIVLEDILFSTGRKQVKIKQTSYRGFTQPTPSNSEFD